MDDVARIEWIKATLRQSAWHVETLRAVRQMRLPDWAIGAGFVRNLIWDRLHEFEQPTPLLDIDVLFLDRSDMTTGREQDIEARLFEQFDDRAWSVRNQARMHLRNGDRPYRSIADAMSFWLETPSCVAARLDDDDELTIVAPLGVGDLIEMRVAPTARGRARHEEYLERMVRKDWPRIWPKVIVDLSI